MTVHYELRNTSLTDTPSAPSTTTRRTSVRLAILAAIVTVGAVVAGASIVTRPEPQVPSAGATAVAAFGTVAAPQGYWNAYLNEWIEPATIETATPQGYWNAYLNEWIEPATIETATPQGYWNAYLNEWIEPATIETATPQGYWNAYLNEWIEPAASTTPGSGS